MSTLLLRHRLRRMVRNPSPIYVRGAIAGAGGLVTLVTFMNTPALLAQIGYCVTQK